MKKLLIAFLMVLFFVEQQSLCDDLYSDDSSDRIVHDISEQSFFTSQKLISSSVIEPDINEYGERPMVVVVCTYNNADWAEKNIDSIFSQNYKNMRAIIIDDCSSDHTVRVIQAYIDKHNLADRVTFVCNKKRTRKLANLYKALYACKDNEIVVMLDGDDWFSYENVLRFLNEYYNQLFNQQNALQVSNQYYNQRYEDSEVWFTYGQYRNEPAEEAIKWGFKEIGYCREVPQKIKDECAYRKYTFVYMHPRSFRAWLFKQIKLEDLIAETVPGFEGDYYPAANDNAICFPMVEMAYDHLRFISNILYVRNLYNEIVGFKVDKKLQVGSSREIRKKPSYPRLNRPKMRDAELQKCLEAQADIFMIARDKLRDMRWNIDVLYNEVHGIHTLYIFYLGTEENKNTARQLTKLNKNIIFVPFYNTGGLTLKNRILECMLQSSQDYIVMVDDTCEVISPINLSNAIYWFERTYAHCFYLQRNMTQKGAPKRFVELEDGVCAWKFLVGNNMWRGVASLSDMALHKKAILLFDINRMVFDDADSLEREMKSEQVSLSKIGLCFKDAKIRRHH